MTRHSILIILLCLCLAPRVLTAEAPDDLSARRHALLQAINQVRAEAALPLLHAVEVLHRVAQAHAEDIAARGRLDHRGSDGAGLAARLHRAGYDYSLAAENLAEGTGDAAATVALWMQSPGHRANLLLPGVRDIGIGYVAVAEPGYPNDRRDYWVLDLGRLLQR